MKRSLVFLVTALIVAAGSSASLAASQDIVKFNSDIEVTSQMVAGDVVAVGGNITVSGTVEKNVVAVGGSVTLKSRARVGESVVAIGGEIVKDPSAQVAGKMTQIQMPGFLPSFPNFMKGGWMVLWATLSVVTLIGFLGLTVLLVALIPDHMGRVVSSLERSFVQMLLWGILWTLLVVPVAALLAISVVGIVLIPFEIMLAVLALIIGYIGAAIFIGKNILLSFRKTPPPFVDAILGIVILFLIGFIPVVGMIVKSLFLIAGFGAVLTTRFGTART